MEESTFWQKVHEVARKVTWAYLATSNGDQPKVRVVHPAFEGRKLWVATGRNSAKAQQIERNPKVEMFFQIGPDFAHLTLTGDARFVDDQAEKKRVWEAKVFDYELAQFWPEGPQSKDFGLLMITPRRVEMISLPAMSQGQKPQVWRA